ncbi:hypothetical protein THASP1DRAFT_22291 [Thamnocephalis sphaerospora]|uniref:Uncharacterized protein n=1 Tax=Thamnocephalis sphaerospora TaxID=78915 RepID=A0A4P9XUK8_9FUNG|nr:hypothetical protein THASP1DRAFT_22291 [Thamnocephalis sphaerospora]|eukprot:RKP09924.1 hypothetical protein THASP1DRAFT_22291 [Thamnocephalis sphaerospora]
MSARRPRLLLAWLGVSRPGLPCHLKTSPATKTLEHRSAKYVDSVQYRKTMSLLGRQAWQSYGNCIDGYCGSDGYCHKRKDDFHACTSANQCAGRLCVMHQDMERLVCRTPGKTLDISYTQLVTVNMWQLILGSALLAVALMLAIVHTLYRRHCRRRGIVLEKDPANASGPAVASYQQKVALGHRIGVWYSRLVAPVRVWRVAAITVGFVGVFFILYALIHAAFAPIAFPDDRL